MTMSPSKLRVNLGDYLNAQKWAIEFPQGCPGTAGISPELLDIRCKSVTPPSSSIEPMEVKIKGAKDVPPGELTFNNEFTVVLAETADAFVHKLYSNWKARVIQANQQRPGTRADFETTVILYRLDNNHKPVWKYVIEYVYPKNKESGELGSDAQPVDITINFAYVSYTEGPV